MIKLRDILKEDVVKYSVHKSKSEDWDWDIDIKDASGKIIGMITLWNSSLYPKHLAIGTADIYPIELRGKGIYQQSLIKAMQFAKSKGFEGIVSDESSRNDMATKAWKKIPNAKLIKGDYFLS